MMIGRANTVTAAGRRGEEGVALAWAIGITILVLATLVVMSSLALTTARKSRDSNARTQSALWLRSAGNDITSRLRAREIGTTFEGGGTLATGDLLFEVPTTDLQTPATSFPVPGAGTQARRLEFTSGGEMFTGWYQVLSPTDSDTDSWSALYVRDATRPDVQGAFELVLRAWADGSDPEPIVARMVFRRGSLARFSVLSEDVISFGDLGISRPMGFVHTNNSRGVSPAIRIGSSGPVQAELITTSSGSISGSCGGAVCRSNIRDIVPFGAGDGAIESVRDLSSVAGKCADGIACSFPASALASGIALDQMPVWVVDLDACGDGLSVGSASVGLRQDTGAFPILDDDVPRSAAIGAACHPVADGGGAFLFDGDVYVQGERSSLKPVTILASRTAAFPERTFGPGTGYTNVPVTTPASIYLDDRRIGSTDPLAPVGLVAAGGVYVPSSTMGASVANNVRVTNVAAMAIAGEIAYGPRIQSVAADATQPGLGLDSAVARDIGLGWANQLRWEGALASSRTIAFRYGTSNSTYLGFRQRRMEYVDELLWNPPPMYPSDDPWKLSDWTEFGT